MNRPTVSKINWTAAAIAFVGILIASGVVPPEYETHVVALITIFMPSLIIVFRTWFTGPDCWWARMKERWL